MKENRLRFFPISLFAIILGLSGLSIAYQKGETFLGIPGRLSHYFLGTTILLFLIILLLYMTKAITYPEELRKDINHPVKLNFFPAISISLILFSIGFLGIDLRVSEILWIAGIAIHLLITIWIMSGWLNKNYGIDAINPAWFIPAVGNILAPVAGAQLGYIEISWFFFSIGLIFWIMLFTIFSYRIIFHNPLPDRLKPTMFIFIAPPAVGFISYVNLTGTVDGFSKILYYFSLFLVLMLFSQAGRFVKIRFYISWWAYTFPIAAVSLASTLMYKKTSISAYRYFAYFFIGFLSLLILVISFHTIRALLKREICVDE